MYPENSMTSRSGRASVHQAKGEADPLATVLLTDAVNAIAQT